MKKTILSVALLFSTMLHAQNRPLLIGGIDYAKIAKSEVTFSRTQSICDTFYSFRIKPKPSALTWDGQYFWYSDNISINKVSTSGVLVDSIPNPAPGNVVGGDLCFDGNYLWYVDEQSARLFKIDRITGSIVVQFHLPSFGLPDPNGYGIAWDGQYLWHSEYSPLKVYKINPLNGAVLNSFIPPDTLVGIEWVNGNLYGIETHAMKIYKLDVITGNFLDSADWCVPLGLGLTWDGFHLWNLSGPDSVSTVPVGGKLKIYEVNSDIISSINDNIFNNNLLKIYPNPTNGQITVEISKKFSYKNLRLNIISVLGEIVKEVPLNAVNSTVNLNELVPGIYFYRGMNGSEILKTGKIIIE